MTLHGNAQAESSDLKAANAGVETSTADAAERNEAESSGPKGTESPEPDGPTTNKFSLPSTRQLSIRRSKRNRRKVAHSSDDTNVEVVVQGGEEDAREAEPGSDGISEDKVEEEEEDNEDEVLQLQERLMKQRCVSAVWGKGGVEDLYVHRCAGYMWAIYDI